MGIAQYSATFFCQARIVGSAEDVTYITDAIKEDIWIFIWDVEVGPVGAGEVGGSGWKVRDVVDGP